MKKGRTLRNLEKEIELCQRSPVRFFERWLGIRNLYDKQVEILEAIRDHSRVAVAACHSSGKTFLAAGAFWWNEICFPNSIAVTTAPTNRQVKELLWGEIRRHFGAAVVPLPGDPGSVFWQMPDGGKTGATARWFGTGFATRPDQAEDHASRFTGYHANYPGRNFTIFDEASGIIRPIYKAAEGLMTGEHDKQLLIGNPLDPVSEFASRYRNPMFHSIRISAFDTPNVKAGKIVDGYEALVSPRFVRDQAELEGEDSPLYVAKVLGEFPAGGDETMIPLGWVTTALERELELEELDPVRSMGIDVARFGNDATTIYVLEGKRILYAKACYGKRTTWTARKGIEIARRFEIGPGRAHFIGVDDTGVGGGVTDTFFDEGYHVNAVDFGGKALESRRADRLSAETKKSPERYTDRFHDRRTELWWTTREWIETACLATAPRRARERLEGDLSTPVYQFKTRSGKTRRILEPKKEMKKRLGRSPDDGDGLTLALAWKTYTPAALPPKLDYGDEDLDDEIEQPGERSIYGDQHSTAGVLEEFLQSRGRFFDD